MDTGDGFASLSAPACAPADPRGPRRDLWYAFEATASSVSLKFSAAGGLTGSLLVSAEEAGGRVL